MCLSGLPDFKTETTYDPGIPEIWKVKWTKEGRYEEEKASLDKYFKETGESPAVANYYDNGFDSLINFDFKWMPLI